MEQEGLQVNVEAIVPLLVRDYLQPADRMALLRCTRATAIAVLQHSPHTTLRLNNSTQHQQQEQQGLSQLDAATLQLMQHAPSLRLAMQSAIFSLPRTVWHHVTSLTLSDMDLTSSVLHSFLASAPQTTLQSLALHRCRAGNSACLTPSRDHELAPACDRAPASQGAEPLLASQPRSPDHLPPSHHNDSPPAAPAAAQHPPTTTSTAALPADAPQHPPTTGGGGNISDPALTLRVSHLTVSNCSPTDQCLHVALSIISPSTLQRLTYKAGQPGQPLPPLHTLPALHQLHAECGVVEDDAFLTLLSHPLLTRVTLDGLLLRQDHSAAEPRALRHLHLLRGCHVSTLAALPLAALQQCVVQTAMSFEYVQGWRGMGVQQADQALSLALSTVQPFLAAAHQPAPADSQQPAQPFLAAGAQQQAPSGQAPPAADSQQPVQLWLTAAHQPAPASSQPGDVNAAAEQAPNKIVLLPAAVPSAVDSGVDASHHRDGDPIHPAGQQTPQTQQQSPAPPQEQAAAREQHSQQQSQPQPAFELLFPEDCSPEHAQLALSMTTRHIHCTLRLYLAPVNVLFAACFHLPQHITTLCFHGNLARSAAAFTNAFIQFLPSHVTHVVLSHWCMESLPDLELMLTGVHRRMQVTLDSPGFDKADPRSDQALTEAVRSVMSGVERSSQGSVKGQLTGQVWRW